MFDQYYGLRGWSEKALFLRTLVKRDVVKDNLNPIVPRTEFTYKYFLTDSNGTQERVCLSFLSRCLCISDSTLKRTFKYSDKNPSAKEQWGKFPTKKYKEKDLKFLRKFIRSFPTYDSHYKISASNKQYLSPFLNIRRMYIEYELKCAFNRRRFCPNGNSVPFLIPNSI